MNPAPTLLRVQPKKMSGAALRRAADLLVHRSRPRRRWWGWRGGDSSSGSLPGRVFGPAGSERPICGVWWAPAESNRRARDRAPATPPTPPAHRTIHFLPPCPGPSGGLRQLDHPRCVVIPTKLIRAGLPQNQNKVHSSADRTAVPPAASLPGPHTMYGPHPAAHSPPPSRISPSSPRTLQICLPSF